MFKKAFGILQRIGRALMLPVALLPAAGLLLAIGTAMQEDNMINILPFLEAAPAQLISELMMEAGGIVFDNLPVIFAIGVALGLANGDGVAGLAALIGYFIINVTMGVIVGVEPEMVQGNPAYAEMLGVPTLQTGVFGGIIAGALGAFMYNRYFNIELPQYLGFFAGKRFVPIATAFGGLIVGALLTIVWPQVQEMLNAMSYLVTEANTTISAFVFGVIERALIPFGLHHVFYNPFWYEFGSYVNAAGQTVTGDQQIFFAQYRDGVEEFTAGTFMTGKFPFMMFGLPAAALAIYHCAKPENKKYVAGIMGSAALTSFLTGITEPLEFSFLFVAPLLFAVHTIFAGLSFMVMHLLDVKIGMTFSGGVIDYFLFGIIPNATPWWLVIPVGLGFAVIYYFGFRFAIQKFNLMTPGREETADVEENSTAGSGSAGDLPYNVLEAFGGKDNLKNLDACITRLRITVNNKEEVDKGRLKQLGASGVMEVGNNVQAIFGPQSDAIKTQMEDIIAGRTPVSSHDNTPEIDPQKEAEPAVQVDSAAIAVGSPGNGRLIAIEEVPDDVFAGKMMGDGFAIHPENGEFVSPVSGNITTVFPTKHAVGITSEDGLDILVHIGIDTVNMKGEGFEVMVEEGEKVTQGQPLVKADLSLIEEKAKSTITPIVFTNLNENQTVALKKEGAVTAADKEVAEVTS
ncbi:PTS system D-glucose-specific IIA component, Glc family /PTS system D-glucose-specific IIB component, Glc family /PTS system D-glucose-specific IIC component, Glc family [Alteribacillus persepolensis]|uniref:PTS system D-glucose-specific IIA component, Glc family /PTS system D-glucose-specific IIB component, Glc family /PTS system D-glucose-specific IIC component, Glc family n=1 Tax=Alteribacillus persepolensis TaxID=568899 RepID=A0A1G8EQR3_9BACI|nr:glucose-specific PTS transporter subunit IIBC [Alteribacillus persepolensis]SDH72215.1 PTS system D-glucose-specific IIA component, Glc family /PTS system D-glucose-specific IIB component, Glc family /PTS system D-glucose-specific IIC component, Glc family [Alteribacillus persepolensis]